VKKLLAVLIAGLALSAHAGEFTKGREIAPLTPDLKAGDYVWKPQASPAGPVVIIVSIPEQALFVYRNGVRIGRSTVSTGAKGHPTPTGVFTIQQKKEDHESSIYKGAKMPYMQRLTWDGIAMHAGRLPGYPASHGCVRLPMDFARKLFEITIEGTTVIVTDQKNGPHQTATPGLLLVSKGDGLSSGSPPPGGFEWQPEKAPSGPVSVIFSQPESMVYVFRNGVMIGRGAFTLRQQKNLFHGTHVYTALARTDARGRRDWLATTSIGGGKAPEVKSLAALTTFPKGMLEKVRPAIGPGATLILTELPVSAQTQSGQAFRILTTDPGQ
jgi:hypothetical protein